MTLIKSISGIRGTIGGQVNESLTPLDVVLFTSGYAEWIKLNHIQNNNITVVVGRDARISGNMIHGLVVNTLIASGIHIVDIGLASTPTTEMAVVAEKAQGGIIITASHNPKEWNALKLLNDKGEFVSENDGKKILDLSLQKNFFYANVENLGTIKQKDYLHFHIQKILDLPLVKKDLIEKKNFKVVVDGINSVGSIAIPAILKALGVHNVVTINAIADGNFNHNPEPLDEHLTEIKQSVVNQKADLGIVVDPDVDRLAFICEDGTMFGEEYTLVTIADYILQHKPGGVAVSNLSSSRALMDVAKWHEGYCFQSAVGEVNVVAMMKEKNAVIGGEGNGGIILPELHYGRDALVGVALFLSYLSQLNITMTELKKRYPKYEMIKHKIHLQPDISFNVIKEKLKQNLNALSINEIDGIRVDFEQSWLHCRPSNTEPIVRLYIEAPTASEANELLNKVITIIELKNE